MNARPPLRWATAAAWRDARQSWRRLIVYLSATSLGIASLVAAGSFRTNLQAAINEQARPLLGADLVISERRAFTPEAQAYIDALPYPRVKETRFTTMALFPGGEQARLIEVRAVDPGFPYYGAVKSDPPGALETVFRERAVLLEDNVLAEYGLALGDRVEIGDASFNITGSLQLVPGEAVASIFISPRAYIDRTRLAETGLVRQQSLARHRVYFQIPDEAERARAVPDIKAMAEKVGFRAHTVADRQRSLGRQARNAERFLGLCALAMLLLGGIGVASIMQAYVRDKWAMAATLRCLGAPAGHTLLIFVMQAGAMGLVGSALGAALGIAFQAAIPSLIAQFVSIPIPFFISWGSVVNGVAAGFAVSLLFSLVPLLSLRHVPPLAAFRADAGPRTIGLRDKAVWSSLGAIALLLFYLASGQMPNLWSAALVPFAVAAALLLMVGLTKLVLSWLQRHIRASLPHAWRHGLANLFRPNNQTFLLVPTIGLGAGLLFLISFSHSSLMRHLSLSTDGEQPNLAIVDIQDDQRAGVAAVVERLGGRIIEEAPIVSMRLARVKDKTAAQLRKNPGKIDRWTLNHEYRSTYRSRLTTGEQIMAGTWPPPGGWSEKNVPVAMEEDLAQSLGLAIGDTASFDVQGVPMNVTIAALRKVDWFQMRPNFFVLFPEGVLEDAPKFFVALTRAADPAHSAALQRELRRSFANLTTMDLRMVLNTLNDYFQKISWLLRFMLGFVVATGLLVLAGALLSTRFERLQEAALLRTLGASRSTVRVIHLVEYGLTGAFAGAAGLALGLAAGWASTRYMFNVPFDPRWAVAPAGVALVAALTTATGLLIGRGLMSHPPLETLRDER